jgi:F0F1-type ATP synthase epsilon subunit
MPHTDPSIFLRVLTPHGIVLEGKTLSVTVLSDKAEDAEGITLDQAEEAKRRAESALADAASLSNDERKTADLALRESLVRIQISIRRKNAQGRGSTPHH